MKIILLQDVAKLGKTGEEHEVSPGYARNFLFPKKLAVHSTEGAKQMAETLRKKTVKQVEVKKKELLQMFDGIVDTTLVITAKAEAGGTLFAGVDESQIAAKFTERGMPVEPEMIKLKQPIKKTGKYTVTITVDPTHEYSWNITINPEE